MENSISDSQRPTDQPSETAPELRELASVSEEGAKSVPATSWHQTQRNRARGAQPGNGNARKHGHHALKRAVSTLGSRTIDRRTAVGRALAAWRADLLADLGGIEAISTQERALVEEAVKTKLLLDSVDAWLLSQATLINKRSRGVVPAVRDRNVLVATLRTLLNDLGLRRRTEEVLDLGAYLATRASPEDAAGAPETSRQGCENDAVTDGEVSL